MSILKVLLIEDNLSVQYVHKYMLTKLGCAVDIADTGLTALKMANDNSEYNIIFVDIGLPDISGFEVIKNITLIPHYNNKMAIIALTGYIGKEEEKACQEAGASQVLHKPVTIEQVREILAQYKN